MSEDPDGLSSISPPGWRIRWQIRRRVGPPADVWRLYAAAGVDGIVKSARVGAEDVIAYLEWLGVRSRREYLPVAEQMVSRVRQFWLELVLLLIAITLVGLTIRADVLGRTEVVVSRALGPFTLIDSTVIRLDTVRFGLGGFTTISDVEGRIAVRPIPSGTRLSPSDLSEFALNVESHSRFAEGTVISLPLEDYFEGAVDACRTLSVLALPAELPPVDSGSQSGVVAAVGRVYSDLVLLQAERVEAGWRALVVAPVRALPDLSKDLVSARFRAVRTQNTAGTCPS